MQLRMNRKNIEAFLKADLSNAAPSPAKFDLIETPDQFRLYVMKLQYGLAVVVF